jgi:hypothetical protein
LAVAAYAKEFSMIQVRPVVRLTTEPLARVKHERVNRRGFAAFIADRPEPVDLIERVLLRLDWFAQRVASRGASHS